MEIYQWYLSKADFIIAKGFRTCMLILKFSFVNCCKQQAIECHIVHSVDSVLVSKYSIRAHLSVLSDTHSRYLFSRQYCRMLSFQGQWCFSPCAYHWLDVIKVENNHSDFDHQYFAIRAKMSLQRILDDYLNLSPINIQILLLPSVQEGFNKGTEYNRHVNICLSCRFISIPVLW